jgi:hypothetical protein
VEYQIIRQSRPWILPWCNCKPGIHDPPHFYNSGLNTPFHILHVFETVCALA